MHYLVTGGLGFIGSHLCDALMRAGHAVTVLDDLSTGKREHLPQGATLIIGDITDAATVRTALGGVDGCFHLAAIASVVRAEKEWARCHAVNLTGTVNIFEAAASIPVVYASSAAVYGATEPPLAEHLAAIPISAYGADKYGCELHAHAGAKIHGLRSVGLRFFNVYGTRQDPHSPYSGVISIFAEKLRAGQDITIFGDGQQTRDFIHVSDVVRALLSSLQGLEAGRLGCEVFNVCTGESTTILALAHLMARTLDATANITHAGARPGDIRHSLGDPAKARAQLSFTAEVPLAEGLRLTLGQG